MRVIPTVFAHNKAEFNARFEKIIEISKEVQIDFMDGKFVHAKSISLKEVPPLSKYKIKFEAHLMCLNPEKYLTEVKRKGFKKIIFHEEVFHTREKIFKFIKECRKKRLEVFIAINPQTRVWDLLPYLNYIDGVLFMGVSPGKEHQRFLSEVYKKINDLKEFNKRVFIQVDGGVNYPVAENLRDLGVNALNSGSFVSESENPKKVIEELEKI
jgi:ribulose-phosphate 3-epimerase